MALTILEEAIQPIYENLDTKDFSALIRQARNALGLKLYKVAEFIGIASARLKNLETGYFRIMPTDVELKVLAKLYDIDVNIIKEKAQEHVHKRALVKQVRFNGTL